MSQTPPTPPGAAAAGSPAEELPHRETGDREEIYYEGSPMIRGNIAKIFLWALVGIVLIAAPIIYAAVQHEHHWPIWWVTLACIVAGLFCLLIPVLIVKSLRYRISNYRIDFERGIFGKRIDTLELWHVEDIQFQQSFLDRILGVGNLTVLTHDDTTPRLTMIGLPNPRPLFETLKQRVIAVKRQRGVVKMDMGGGGHGDITNT
ncbi:MAG TPA: PH domain-containing protein [Tepidisphaeraceae bacterium]|jgi:membrane protein YdbS with pleckstrin-like domain